MTAPRVEAFKDRIIVTGDTPAEVRDATFSLFLKVGSAFADFTAPVRQTDGAFVSTGRVRLAGDNQ